MKEGASEVRGPERNDTPKEKHLSSIGIAMTCPDTRAALLQEVKDVSTLSGLSKTSTWIQRVLYGSIPAGSLEADVKRDVLCDAECEHGEWPEAHGVRKGLASIVNQRRSIDETADDRYWHVVLDYLAHASREHGLKIHQGGCAGGRDPRNDLRRNLVTVTEHLEKNEVRVPDEVTAVLRGESCDPLPLVELIRENWSLLATHFPTWMVMTDLVSSLDDWGLDARSRQDFFAVLEDLSKARAERKNTEGERR